MATNFFQDLDARMRRAVQQESRSLSSSLSGNNSKRKQKQLKGRWCLLLILLTPVAILFMIIYMLNMYNAMVRYDEQQQALFKQIQLQEQRLHHEKEESEKEQQQVKLQMLRKRRADAARLEARQYGEEEEGKRVPAMATAATTLVLTTHLGPIRIRLRPDLSQGSVDYIHRLIDSKVCRRCNFYRAEKPGILQGVIANRDIPTNKVPGSCPEGADTVENNCPKWDPHCSCHGPLMSRGSVAWAAGDPGGPDFFIDAYKRPAKWWGTQHTNFGFIDDPASMALVDRIFDLPVSENNGMHYLKDSIHFDMSLE